MEDENIKTKTNRKFKISYIITILITAIITFLLCHVEYRTGDIENNNSDDKISITYIGIDYDDDSVYAYFDISSTYTLNLKSIDFSVKIDNLPVTANYIKYGSFYEFDIDIKGYDTILVRFDKKKSELDSPIIFYYKGIMLELGKSLEI